MKSKWKKIGNAALFLAIMLLTFYTVFKEQDMPQLLASLSSMNILCLAGVVFLAVFFVCAEGSMIWYLLKARGGVSSLPRCFGYSFVGFFYSAITPSATGGQPMQLYYMKKDGNNLSDSSVILMVVATIYKFVLSVIGILLLGFWYGPLIGYFKGYIYLYYLGLTLNVVLVIILVMVMMYPISIKRIIVFFDRLLVKMRILKPSRARERKVTEFIFSYDAAVKYLRANKGKIVLVTLMTFLQRGSAFVVTALVYAGLGLSGTSLFTVILVQAAVYIAVDMLPIPGAQGITELVYVNVFNTVFINNTLAASMLVVRGINFYLLLIISAVITAIFSLTGKKKEEITIENEQNENT
ncbi:MAG: flippase-like domain-containing protein [Lachnospiraceae bacterium]|nr:flippase-like domain-containing protein [Lachnospiraceae bacterium]